MSKKTKFWKWLGPSLTNSFQSCNITASDPEYDCYPLTLNTGVPTDIAVAGSTGAALVGDFVGTYTDGRDNPPALYAKFMIFAPPFPPEPATPFPVTLVVAILVPVVIIGGLIIAYCCYRRRLKPGEQDKVLACITCTGMGSYLAAKTAGFGKSTSGGATTACNKCGAQTPTDSRFCETCGNPGVQQAAQPVTSGAMPMGGQAGATMVAMAPLATLPMTDFCENCGRRAHQSGLAFCDVCGSRFPAADPAAPPAYVAPGCTKCQAPLQAGMAFCTNCGTAAPVV